MTKVDHLKNYRMALPLGAIIALASVAGAVIFVVYAAEWNEKNDINILETTAGNLFDDSRDKRNLKTRAHLAYYATVIALLLLLVFFHGYQLTKIVL